MTIKMLTLNEVTLLTDRRYASLSKSTVKDDFMRLWRETNVELERLKSPEILFGDIDQLYSQSGPVPSPQEAAAYIRGMRGEQ